MDSASQSVSRSVSHLHAFRLEEWELWLAVNQAEEITGTDDLRYPPKCKFDRFSSFINLPSWLSSHH